MTRVEGINNNVYYPVYVFKSASFMKYSEFKRWLEKQGVRFKSGKGSHLHVELNGKHSVLPFHGSKEIPGPLVAAVKKDLGLK